MNERKRRAKPKACEAIGSINLVVQVPPDTLQGIRGRKIHQNDDYNMGEWIENKVRKRVPGYGRGKMPLRWGSLLPNYVWPGDARATHSWEKAKPTLRKATQPQRERERNKRTCV